jgi:molecular chaperone HtpG
MANGNVGAGILNLITESLYDKPIVVFREYVQNSVDSFLKVESRENKDDLCSKIWTANNNLYFLDNGNGIDENDFVEKMHKIAYSEKRKTENIGYKGIGRLSGLPYCDKLIFVNICSFRNNTFQKYCIDGFEYKKIKNQLYEMDIEELMTRIGTYSPQIEDDELEEIKLVLQPYNDIFAKQDTGFLVILDNMNLILNQTITSDKGDIYTELGWLLPVKFKNELLESNVKQLFEEITEVAPETMTIPAKSYNITFNDVPLERPISLDMLRDYTCKTNFKYAIGFHSFYRDKIAVTRGNLFSGIKLYLDNILLCDENELIPFLHNNGFLSHSVNELIQSVKGMGVIIYITDKVNISANARRTFIEVTDHDATELLKSLAKFIRTIVAARYDLSRYSTAKNDVDQQKEKLDQLREAANMALKQLASDEITIESEYDTPSEFKDLNDTEKKQAVKRKLTREMNQRIKIFLSQTSAFDYDNVVSDFITWVSSNNNS